MLNEFYDTITGDIVIVYAVSDNPNGLAAKTTAFIRGLQEAETKPTPSPLSERVAECHEKHGAAYPDDIRALNTEMAERIEALEARVENTVGCLDSALDIIEDLIISVQQKKR